MNNIEQGKRYISEVIPENDTTETILSPRQSEILNMLAQGFEQHEIAEAMGITFATVSTHIHKPDAKGHKLPLFQRLQVNSAPHAIAQGYLHDLIDTQRVWSDLDLSRYSLLSKREHEVFTHVTDMQAIGLKMRDVAQELGVAPRTITLHNNSIYKKLHLRNINHAVSFRFAYMAAQQEE